MELYLIGAIVAFIGSAVATSLHVLNERNPDYFMGVVVILAATITSWLSVALATIFLTTYYGYNKYKNKKDNK